MTQLLYYMKYLIDFNLPDLFDELLAQFEMKHPILRGNLTESFSELIDNMASFMKPKIDFNAQLGKLLGVLGLISS